MKKSVAMALLVLIIALGCAPGQNDLQKQLPLSLSVQIENTGSVARTDAPVKLMRDAILARVADFNAEAFAVLDGGRQIAAQAVDSDKDGQWDYLLTMVDLNAGESRKMELRYAAEGRAAFDFVKRTQAELSVKQGGHFENRKYIGGTFHNIDSLTVPTEHTDHSFYIRYEGPGWESDKVGYRFYLDWRNAIDIFGKKTPDMVLQNVGQDGFDSYHELSDWGVDVLKVGESLGIGSIGMWTGGKAHRVAETEALHSFILDNGTLWSRIRTVYSGWKVDRSRYDLSSELSIAAGSRITWNDLEISAGAPNLCTGIVKAPDTELITGGSEDGWRYLATYGVQTLQNDKLGMAVLYRADDLLEITEDDLNHVVVLNPASGMLTYGFLAAWEEEPGGIKDVNAFKTYLDNTVQKLDAPVTVIY